MKTGDFVMVWRRIFRRPELTPVEARQGFLDRPVLMVLVVSTFLVCVAFGIAWLTT
ncbi:MAG: hypothetical protein K8F62_19615 [Pseudorhodoplanes sp.]|nr:hypothetical protein [Pseudorhodoplanes sp.]